MKKRQILMTVAGGIFFLSLFFLVFSIYLIYSSGADGKQALEEWETKKQQSISPSAEQENPVSVVDRNNFAKLNKNTLQTSPKDLSANSDRSETTATEPLYLTKPNKGDIIGKITIPKLQREIPIIEGTNQQELKKGVGHYIDSVLPGQHNNSVIAGHRDSVFRGLGELQSGDVVTIETTAGTFTYQIEGQQIVEKDDLSVVQSQDRPLLTMITCYPFNYVGNAPKRYILTAELVNE